MRSFDLFSLDVLLSKASHWFLLVCLLVWISKTFALILSKVSSTKTLRDPMIQTARLEKSRSIIASYFHLSTRHQLFLFLYLHIRAVPSSGAFGDGKKISISIIELNSIEIGVKTQKVCIPFRNGRKNREHYTGDRKFRSGLKP